MYQQVKGLSYRAWMAKADDDRSLARSALVSDKYPSMACYLTQQAMEKYMKAQLVSLGEVPERTHDLSLLLDHLYLASGEEPDLAIAADAGLLSSYEATTRYPGISFSADDVTRAIGAYGAMAESLREAGFEVPGWDDPARYVDIPPSGDEPR
ncbi:MAG: HEPN domain-containing protein [Coriobacteriaceae bacterium]|nr:HEPN domain-containing protein [Coriobacteriaceae bacterium]MCI6845461.1 HEPN domain-containing protein [Coriobacteriaceae bacterium]MDD7585294.1 HEPN domain-containing protein [Coriobacteriaceae bacterium]